MSTTAVILGVAGFILFTLGLLIGFVIPNFSNPRMGLSAHLTACQTGTALTVFALFWTYLSVPAAWSPWLAGLFAGSSYVLTIGITLSAIFGAGEALPIAGGEMRANQFRERMVTFLVNGSGIVMGITCLIIAFFALSNLHLHL